ncbi:MAG: LON peptidase substrate-binding domain-containing protein [Chloroflexi bacterium]|nr:LON peptidase substrate-binding domain-containing protein [Chloroflexota bacterium]
MADQESQPIADPEELRLFPLNVILFPGGLFPLHIFEERYKLMIGECLKGNLPFGVVLIKEGPEVGGLASPHKVGTTARITKAERLEEGRYTLQTVGEKRFRIQEITRETPYLMAKVEYLEDEGLEDLGELPKRAGEVLAEYWKTLAGVKGGWVRSVDTPKDPLALSYAVARSVAHPPVVGQYLLQMSSVKERLERALPLLDERLTLAREELEKRTPFQGPRLN